MVEQVKKSYDFLKKLPKGLLAMLITAMPVLCYLAVTYYLNEHSKNEELHTILSEQRMHTANQQAMMVDIRTINREFVNVYNYIDRSALASNKYIINQVGKRMQFIINYQNPKQALLIKTIQDWMDDETQKNEMEKERLRKDTFNLNIGVNKK